FQEEQDAFLKKRQNFDLLFENIKDKKDQLNLLKVDQAQLRLKSEHLEILNILLLNFNDKNSPNTMTLKDVSQKIKGKYTEPTIRYNLHLLERRRLIIRQKIGRINYYRPNSLKSIVEIEQRFHENLWNEKKKRMNEVIQFFQKTPKRLPEKLKDFEVKANIKEIKETMIKLINNADKEIFIDFRCGFERIDPIKGFLEEIFYSLLEILRKKVEIRLKILLYIDDWLIHKFDNIFLQFISEINSEKFEIRVPIEKEQRELRIIIDEKTIFQIIGVYELTENENGLTINNNITARQAKFVFNQIWENSLDIRDAIIEYTINKDLEKAIKVSEKKYPIKYNFTDKFIVISGLKIGLKFYLHLFENAQSEVLTIQGPIFKTGERTLSVLDTLSQEKFYDKLNSLVPKKIKDGINFKWIRNITVPHLTIYPKDELKRFFIDLILRMYPEFQMRQISFEQFQFAIIDQKILCFFEYSEFSKLTLIHDNFLIQKYNSIFQKLWFDAYDIRLQWITEISEPLQKYVISTFNKIELQVPKSKDKIPADLEHFINKYGTPE
ncbi:MAG: hypothetical protein HWN67_12095, partial [Candidatus Helarchaeota archaeon]|nr:hypothetical protein [Candidatus Helarchaeota archaeon]